MTVRLSSAPPPGASLLPERSTDHKNALRTGLALTCLLLLMARITVKSARPLDNEDTWFHLRIGHELWGPWSLRTPGQLSRFATSSWLPTQWSTEMLAAKLEDWFGLPGVAWLFGACYLLLVVAVYLVCRAQGGPLPATVATTLAVIASLPALSARPQVVSLLLLAVVVGSWLRTARTLRVPWHLVPLTWVWATAHGLWSAGVIVSVVCCIGILLDRRPGRRVSLLLLSVPALSILAACVTPIGPRLLTSQLAVGQRTAFIGEWGATSFRTIPAFVIAVMIGLVVMRWARSREVPWLRLFLLLLACGWAVLVTRMVACSAVIVAPLLALAVQDLLAAQAPWVRPRRPELAVVAAGLVGCLAVLAFVVPRTTEQPAGVPSAFTARLVALPTGSAVAVEDGMGAWIEWRFPTLSPIIDGMMDAYPVSYIKGFYDYRQVKPGWKGYLRASGATVAILRKDSPLSAAMEHQLRWRMLDTDSEWIYLVAPGAY